MATPDSVGQMKLSHVLHRRAGNLSTVEASFPSLNDDRLGVKSIRYAETRKNDFGAAQDFCSTSQTMLRLPHFMM